MSMPPLAAPWTPRRDGTGWERRGPLADGSIGFLAGVRRGYVSKAGGPARFVAAVEWYAIGALRPARPRSVREALALADAHLVALGYALNGDAEEAAAEMEAADPTRASEPAPRRARKPADDGVRYIPGAELVDRIVAGMAGETLAPLADLAAARRAAEPSPLDLPAHPEEQPPTERAREALAALPGDLRAVASVLLVGADGAPVAGFGRNVDARTMALVLAAVEDALGARRAELLAEIHGAPTPLRLVASIRS